MRRALEQLKQLSAEAYYNWQGLSDEQKERCDKRWYYSGYRDAIEEALEIVEGAGEISKGGRSSV